MAVFVRYGRMHWAVFSLAAVFLLAILLICPAAVCAVVEEEAAFYISDTVCPSLMKAIRNKTQASISKTVKTGIDLNIECPVSSKSLGTDRNFPLTPLIVAAENGDTGVAKLLLSLGADINKTVKIIDPESCIPLFFKPANAHGDGYGIEEMTLSPLLAAIILQDVSMASFLLENGAKHNEAYVFLYDNLQNKKMVRGDKQSVERTTLYPLELARIFKNNHLILLLLKYDVDLRRDTERFGSYILTFLIENGASLKEITEALKYTDVNFGYGSRYGYRQPLQSAVTRGDIKVVDFLLKNGAKIALNPSYQEDQELYIFAAKNQTMIRYLRELGLKPARARLFGSDGPTPISNAIYADNSAVLSELIDIGFDPDVLASGWAPLHNLAKGKGNQAALEVLVKHGADVNIHFKNSCRFDLDPPCNPLEMTGNITPLMYAVYEHPNPYATVKILIENGANPKLKTKTGLTAADIWATRLRMCETWSGDWGENEKFLYQYHSKGKCAFEFSEKISELVSNK